MCLTSEFLPPWGTSAPLVVGVKRDQLVPAGPHLDGGDGQIHGTPRIFGEDKGRLLIALQVGEDAHEDRLELLVQAAHPAAGGEADDAGRRRVPLAGGVRRGAHALQQSNLARPGRAFHGGREVHEDRGVVAERGAFRRDAGFHLHVSRHGSAPCGYSSIHTNITTFCL